MMVRLFPELACEAGGFERGVRAGRPTRSGTGWRDSQLRSTNGKTMAPALMHVSAEMRGTDRALDQRDDSRESLRVRRALDVFVRRPRQSTLPHRLGRVAQSLRDVFGLQVGIEVEDLGRGHSARNHVDDDGHRNAHPADARCAVHLVGTNGDAGEGHAAKLARAQGFGSERPRLFEGDDASDSIADAANTLSTDSRPKPLSTRRRIVWPT